MCPFSNRSNAVHRVFSIATELKSPLPPELETEPKTLGEKLRRRRIELGLQQKEVAARLSVTTSTAWNWEHGWAIRKKFVPRIVQFLRKEPNLPPETIER
ncbi:helix-turn-helix domain-containing protein [Geothermobacter hydrogeniphilus]|uniref:HTH cro/C1-type domain-containing protein n=1 Tax=Geothermobacter hydrogeniphilus TaxID=1969733 RepID=A0A1X0YA95_9BACT|nr:helix-turn-helix transcriptional regulator [Geothermobacter hydrogeniphilus]ORJ62022.1 hypothetical protein B5V00_04515 [Geothermobacter hydrogeniphilus]